MSLSSVCVRPINWNNQARRNISVARASAHSTRAWEYAHDARARTHATLVHNDDAVSTRRGCSFSLRQIRKRIINTGDPGSMITRINSRMDELCSRSALSLSSQREKETDDERSLEKRQVPPRAAGIPMKQERKSNDSLPFDASRAKHTSFSM